MMNAAEPLIDMAYDALEGLEDLMAYHERHGTPSLQILTQHSPLIAAESARLLAPDITGKIVIEVGAGVGYLAIEMARYAKQIFAIEVDPAWSWIFTKALYVHKPQNLTWIFGSAETCADWLRGDVAIIFTNSGIKEMKRVASRMAPKVIMPYKPGRSEHLLHNFLKGLPHDPETAHCAETLCEH